MGNLASLRKNTLDKPYVILPFGLVQGVLSFMCSGHEWLKISWVMALKAREKALCGKGDRPQQRFATKPSLVKKYRW